MPGIVEHRFNQLQEIEAILNYLNIELRRLRSSYFKKYLENYQRALSSRDVDRYVDGEELLDYRKKWTGELLDKVMSDYVIKEQTKVNTEETTEQVVEEITEE